MRKTKKALVALLVITSMILAGFASVAAAAGFPDVTDPALQAKVNRLVALGILNGYPDGTYKPGNPITRAEFAKVICIALGLKEAANTMAGVPTAFSDVPSTHWATGFINVAASYGIINGYPDGTFKPDAQVTYAEALAMIVRALGYEPTLKGVWPSKYLIKAAELGITKGVSFAANAPATRGDVAALVDNSLTVAKVIQVGFGDTAKYIVSGAEGTTKVTLLDNLGASSVEGFLLSSPELFGVTDKIKVWVDSNGNWTIDANELVELKLAGAQYSGLLGHKVKAWKNTDGEVFSIEDLTAASDVKVAKVETDKLTVGGTALTDTDLVTGGVFVVWNSTCSTAAENRKTTVTDLRTAVQNADNGEVTLVYSGGKVLAAIGAQSETRIVDSVSVPFESIATKTIAGSSDSLSLKDKNVRWSGAATKLADLQKGDVIEYYSWKDAAGKVWVNIVVTRNTVTGDLSRADTAADKLTIAGTEYKYLVDDSAVTGLLGKSVTVRLNKHGKVVAVESAAPAAAKTIAALYGDPWSNYPANTGAPDKYVKVRVIKSDGTEAIYAVAKDAVAEFDPTAPNSVATLTSAGVKGKSVIEFTTNADGQINSITVLYRLPDDLTTEPLINIVKDYGTVNGQDPNNQATGSLVVTSGTAIFDLYSDSGGKPLVVSRDRLMAETDGAANGRLVPTKAGEAVAKVIAITGNLTAPQVATYGLVTGKYVTAGPKCYLGINVKGSITDYEVGQANYDAFAADDVVKFNPTDVKATVTPATELTVTTADYVWKVQEIDAANKLVYVGKYEKATGNEVAGTRTAYLVVSDTQVFDLNGDNPAVYVRFEDLAVGQEVRMYGEAAPVAKVIVIVR